MTLKKAVFAQRMLLEYVSKRESSVNSIVNPLGFNTLIEQTADLEVTGSVLREKK